MHPVLKDYVEAQAWDEKRAGRMVNGLRVLQEIASTSHEPVTFGAFAARLQPRPVAATTVGVLQDIGTFCNEAGWPNVTCFAVSATTRECSNGFTNVSSETPRFARDAAWFAYSVYKNAPRVDDEA